MIESRSSSSSSWLLLLVAPAPLESSVLSVSLCVMRSAPYQTKSSGVLWCRPEVTFRGFMHEGDKCSEWRFELKLQQENVFQCERKKWSLSLNITQPVHLLYISVYRCNGGAGRGGHCCICGNGTSLRSGLFFASATNPVRGVLSCLCIWQFVFFLNF